MSQEFMHEIERIWTKSAKEKVMSLSERESLKKYGLVYPLLITLVCNDCVNYSGTII